MTLESTTGWYALSNSVRVDYVKEIQVATLELDDSVVDFGSLNTIEKNIFKVSNNPTRVLPYRNLNIQNSVTYELSNTRTIYYR